MMLRDTSQLSLGGLPPFFIMIKWLKLSSSGAWNRGGGA
jgi:hypothetical protein